MRTILKRCSIAAACFLLTQIASVLADINVAHVPVEKARSGERIPLQASVSGDDIRVARAYFRSAVSSRYFFVPLQPQSSGGYLGVLPAPRLGSDNVNYFLLAATTAGQIFKTDSYEIDVEDDEDALARSEIKEPKDIEIDLDKFEEAKDHVDRLGKKPDPAQQVPVGSETELDQTPQIPGFADFIIAAQQEALLAAAIPLAAGAAVAAGSAGATKSTGGTVGGMGRTGWLLVGGAAVAGGIAAASGGGGSGGSQSPGPTGVQIGADAPPPNGNQQAPLGFELIPVGGAAVSPLRLRYNGSDLGTWNGTVTQSFPLSAVGGRLELILTQNVTGGSFICHFRTSGGQAPTGAFNGNAGDYFIALPR